MKPTDVLLVVDVQNDFLPGGALAVPGGDEVIAPINRLAQRFASVILTQDWHTPGHVSFASRHRRAPFSTIDLPYGRQVLWPDHCVQGTRGAQFAETLAIPHAQAVIRKGYHVHTDSYSAFLEADRRTPTGLAGLLWPQVPAIATGFALAVASAWRNREAAVTAVEERDGVCFYVEHGSAFDPIKLVRTPGLMRGAPRLGSP